MASLQFVGTLVYSALHFVGQLVLEGLNALALSGSRLAMALFSMIPGAAGSPIPTPAFLARIGQIGLWMSPEQIESMLRVLP